MRKNPGGPVDVLREFVDDVKMAYGSGDALDREALARAWPDLLATYDHALACLANLNQSVDGKNEAGWRCPDCGRVLSRADWTYVDLADRGIPICGDCDCDMRLIPSAGHSGAPASSSNTWIILEPDTRSVVPRIYDDHEQCAADAGRLDNALIVGCILPVGVESKQGNQEHGDV